MMILDRLLVLAGFSKCPICGKWTTDYRGWTEEDDLCAECFDMMYEAESILIGDLK